ncbi:MAG: transcriptional activator NhaR [Myxococcales bacterium]|nr:transcriptional activator NhaR [Myxococcales bacterium]
MESLNYHHLRYFWVVAREGGLVPAGKVLRLSHPTLSAQIHTLEAQLGEPLFNKVGRRLVLSETGRVVFRYADEIFKLGHELVDAVGGRPVGQPMRLNVGAVDAVPKLVVSLLLRPALSLPEPVRLICHEDAYDKLLADLSLHALDVLIADAPLPTGSSVRAYSHLLGETGMSVFGAPPLAKAYKRGFPRSLHGAPMLLPLEHVPLRRSLDQWFAKHGLVPRIVGEFEDSALLKVFGSEGVGLVVAPSAVEREIAAQYRLQLVGRIDEVRERFYAITGERKLKHPAVVALTAVARSEVFAR